LTNIIFYAIVFSSKKLKKGGNMGYKKLGKNMSFAASGSESLPLGETWL